MAGNTIHVKMTGPTVEGLAPAIVAGMLTGALEEVADYAKYDVLITLDEVLQHPTGYYESQVQLEERDPLTYSLNDNNVIYGPWLEGISPRNETTRFKGYHTFRIVQGRISNKRAEIVEAWVGRTVGRL